MSNYLAIAIVTAALREMVQAAVHEAVPGAIVRVGPPRAVPPGEKEANIYLYRLSSNPYHRNDELPVRSAEGTTIGRAQLAVELHYVISFAGEEQLASEVMLGKVAALLHGRPVLGLDELASIVRSGGALPSLAASDAVTQSERVTLTPEFLSLDELSKLWTVFFQLAHRPSLQYIASPVLIDAGPSPSPVPLVAGVGVGGL